MQEYRTYDPDEAPSRGKDFIGKMMFKLSFGGRAGVLEDGCKFKEV